VPKTQRPAARYVKPQKRLLPLLPGYEPRRPLVLQVGRRIHELRTDGSGGRATQGAVAKKARISVSFLSMIERGERSPSIETLGDIADALGVSLSELFHDGSSPPELNPALRRIGDFVQRKQLNRGEVDRLLSVADAIFSD
jgi:transcriptional regulator with XRE-family HTH domain